MEYVKQFVIIILISFIGEVLHALIPLPVPASIYGIIILFIALETKVLKLKQIKQASSFLLNIMPALFIPVAVGLMDVWGFMKSNLAAYFIISIVTTILVMGASGRMTQFIIRKSAKGGKKHD